MKTIHILIVVSTLLFASTTHAGLFGSKTTREYRSLRDAGKQALKKGQQGVAMQKFLAAYEVVKNDKDGRYYAESLDNVGTLLLTLEMWAVAEPILRERYDLVVKKRGTNHLDTAGAAVDLGIALLGVHRFDEAFQRLSAADHTVRWKAGRYSPVVGYTKALMADALLLAEREEEAIPLFEQAFTQSGRTRHRTFIFDAGTDTARAASGTFTPDPRMVAALQLDYAIALGRMGRYEEEEENVQAAQKLLVERVRHPLPDLVIAHAYARAAEAIRDRENALRHLREAEAAENSPAGLALGIKGMGAKEIYGFHVRQRDTISANAQKQVLLKSGVSEAEVSAIEAQNMRLANVRAIGRSVEAAIRSRQILTTPQP